MLAVALVAQFASDFAISVAREWFALRIDPRRLVRPLLWVFMIDALLAPVGLAAAAASAVTNAALLLPLPLLGLIWVFARERTNRLDQALELSAAYRGTAYLLGDVLEADDEYTGTHSREVVDLVLGVCDELGLDRRSRRTAEFVALLHDIGKIKIPSKIINKPGASPRPSARSSTRTPRRASGCSSAIGGLLARGRARSSARATRATTAAGTRTASPASRSRSSRASSSCCDAYSAITTTRPYREARSSDVALDRAGAQPRNPVRPDRRRRADARHPPRR